MSFAVTDDQRQLVESLRRMLADKNHFESRRRRLAAKNPDRLALWTQLAELGVIGAAFDEASGGFAGDARTVATILWELGASLAVEPYLATAVIAGHILQNSTLAGAADLTNRVIAGEEVCVVAHDAGADPFAAPNARAEAVDGGWIISGRLRCIRHADVANSFLVPTLAEHAVAIFRMPLLTDGLSVQLYRLIDGAGAGDVELDRVRLPPEARLTFAGEAQEVLNKAIEWGLLGLSAETAGIVDTLNSETFSYLRVRKQFGVPIASFQALRHRAADMYIAAEETIAAVDAAIDSMSAPPDAVRSAMMSAAKVVADVAGERIGHEAVQLHGGMGVSDELKISHFARRLTAIRAELGTADVHRLRFANLRP
jgi:alkylation response protein AidB-like acyl-CoA dehydrogenase